MASLVNLPSFSGARFEVSDDRAGVEVPAMPPGAALAAFRLRPVVGLYAIPLAAISCLYTPRSKVSRDMRGPSSLTMSREGAICRGVPSSAEIRLGASKQQRHVPCQLSSPYAVLEIPVLRCSYVRWDGRVWA
jgi:hypothetical protein